MAADVRTEDGCRLWVDQVGAGGPLVLCPDGPGLWDHLGSVDRFATDLDVVREHLAGPQTALLGHSWGVHLALRYAIEHSRRVSRWRRRCRSASGSASPDPVICRGSRTRTTFAGR
ncbi:alpha/beta fold hydrolase [Micromonospora sp. CNB394]|uniref:alpha/beta fold hydrolase n=1 Tax=Micromonospora sp. CNB394 TaxID=1169151 RepID=UPI001E5FED06|nr:alpha/beta fold hydrolase [Micromonospora sp. CNB394]